MPKAGFNCIDEYGENWCYLKIDTELIYPGESCTVNKGDELKASARIKNTGSGGYISLWVKDETANKWLCNDEMWLANEEVATFVCYFTADWFGTHNIRFYACHKEDTTPIVDDSLDSISVHAKAYAKLKIHSMTVDPSNPKVNEEFKVKAKVRATEMAYTLPYEFDVALYRKKPSPPHDQIASKTVTISALNTDYDVEFTHSESEAGMYDYAVAPKGWITEEWSVLCGEEFEV